MNLPLPTSGMVLCVFLLAAILGYQIGSDIAKW